VPPDSKTAHPAPSNRPPEPMRRPAKDQSEIPAVHKTRARKPANPSQHRARSSNTNSPRQPSTFSQCHAALRISLLLLKTREPHVNFTTHRTAWPMKIARKISPPHGFTPSRGGKLAPSHLRHPSPVSSSPAPTFNPPDPASQPTAAPSLTEANRG